jgi:N6-L-threonylcarbamoyladenine synthase
METVILGIESSCDETSAAICLNGKVTNNIIATQSVHIEYGGVVPELASRAHQQQIVPVVHAALHSSNITNTEITAIACTQGPGLLGSLLVGYSFAKSLAYSLNVPLINVHHMHAHILAHFIDNPTPNFPFLCLTVSGGHTQIVLVSDYNQMKVIGQTLDDAVGEAFDKGAKIMGLPYPGGPMIDQYAEKGDPFRFTFSQSSIPELDFSFSGVKTSLLYFLQKEMRLDSGFIQKNLADLCASYQRTLIQMLTLKVIQAAENTGISQIAIAGGVAANRELRRSFLEISHKRGWDLFIPKFEYCTDNAAMIAISGYFKFLKGDFAKLGECPEPRLIF